MKKEHIFLGSLVIIILFALAMEITSRLLYEKITLPAGRKSIDVLLGKSDIYNYSLIMPHAYMLYENTPLWEDQYRQINSLGYRGQEFSQMPNKNKIRILTIGGSTTFDGGIKNPSETWTAQLEKIFSKNGYHVEAINGGLNAATSAEMVSHYMFKNRYIKSDIVIINLGWNDTTPLLFKNYDPTYGSFRRWGGISITSRNGEKELLQYSYFARVIYAWWLGNPKLSDLLLFPAEWNDEPPEIAMQNVKRNHPIGFERNLDLLVQTILTDGAKPILFIEPIAAPEIFNTYHDARIQSIFPSLQLAYEKDKMIVRRISKKYHVPLIEMPSNSIPIEGFVDHAHVNPAGAKIKANFIYQHFPMSDLKAKV